MARPKRRNEADYLEEEIPVTLQSFLDRIRFPEPGLAIRKFGIARERDTGADAQIGEGIEGIRPFYMQFKRPCSWEGFAEDAVIISDRMARNLDVNPRTLFFELRRKAKTHSDFQHNMLFKLRQSLMVSGTGDAAYVCPLFMEFSKYRTHMHNELRNIVLINGIPWTSQHVWIRDSITSRVDFNSVPVLTRHVSIPPHALIDTHEHSYSFRPDGQQLCFHSPEELPENSYLLSDWLNGLFDLDSPWLDRENSDNAINELISSLRLSENELRALRSGENWIDRWLRFGGFLSRNYSIHQFAFIRRNGSERYDEA